MEQDSRLQTSKAGELRLRAVGDIGRLRVMGTVLQPDNFGPIRTICQICEKVLMLPQGSPDRPASRLAFFRCLGSIECADAK
jgi:hypothetical protein